MYELLTQVEGVVSNSRNQIRKFMRLIINYLEKEVTINNIFPLSNTSRNCHCLLDEGRLEYQKANRAADAFMRLELCLSIEEYGGVVFQRRRPSLQD